MNGLSEILRPNSFENFIGQEHLLGEGALLRMAIETNNLFSAILVGPPGSGKTSVLGLLRKYTDYEIIHLNAAFTSVEDVKKWERYAYSMRDIKKVVLFIDELHRFNKKQQDVFLPGVETGTYILFGTTTENPQYTINPALLSRCRVLRFKKLSPSELDMILQNAVNRLGVDVKQSVKESIIASANGDARFLLNTYELLSNMAKLSGKNAIDDSVYEMYVGEYVTK
ncbi:MAG: AAA family ATPase [Fervidobacterium sp.]